MIEKPKNKYLIFWLGLAAFAWLMLFVWQGLDFTDMGFWLTSYQQFYTHPDTIWGVCWLSSFIGHWIGVALGEGVLAYRLGHVMVFTMCAVIAYRVLATQFGNSLALAAMVLLNVCFTRVWLINWIDYNDLTALFYLVGAAFLFFGIERNRNLLIMLAGVVLGINVLIRLPNLLGVALVAAIWLQALVHRRNLSGTIIRSFIFLSGFVLGVIIITGLIILHGHEAIYTRSLAATFADCASSDLDSPHQGMRLIKAFLDDYMHVFMLAALVVMIMGGAAHWIGKQKNSVVLVLVPICAVMLFCFNHYRINWKGVIPGFFYIMLLMIMVLELRKKSPVGLLAFIAGLVFFLVPLGSTNGFYQSIYGMWLALPLVFVWLWQSPGHVFQFKVTSRAMPGEKHLLTVDVREIRIFTLIIASAMLLQSIAAGWRHTFRDSTNRLAMTHAIAHPLLTGTYTTAARAKVVAELLEAMARFTKPGDAVLAYNGTITIYFLTHTHPWLGISWPDFAGKQKLLTLIRQKEQSGLQLSCIVRATGNTYNETWPIDSQPPSTFWHQEDSRSVFAAFAQRHGYGVAWSNNFFEILTILPHGTAANDPRVPKAAQ